MFVEMGHALPDNHLWKFTTEVKEIKRGRKKFSVCHCTARCSLSNTTALNLFNLYQLVRKISGLWTDL